MARLSSDVRFSLASEADPAMAVQQINEGFAHQDWQDRFVTMIAAVVNPQTHELTLVNAGHMSPMIRRADGTIEEVGDEEAGLPLGVAPGFEYSAYTRTLSPGEVVTIFTDGISEAMNQERSLYGLDRLRKELATPNVAAAELGEHILDDVRRFADGFAQSDDMCLVCFGRTEG
jgi:serine phosphatase RsbU (regulator of sigma subunit)